MNADKLMAQMQADQARRAEMARVRNENRDREIASELSRDREKFNRMTRHYVRG